MQNIILSSFANSSTLLANKGCVAGSSISSDSPFSLYFLKSLIASKWFDREFNVGVSVFDNVYIRDLPLSGFSLNYWHYFMVTFNSNFEHDTFENKDVMLFRQGSIKIFSESQQFWWGAFDIHDKITLNVFKKEVSVWC